MKELILFGFVAISQNNAQSNKWEPLEFLIGKWEGQGVGKFGNSEVVCESEYLMGKSNG